MGKPRSGGLGRPALAEHHKLQLFQRCAGHLVAQDLQRFQQQIRPLAGIGAAAHDAKEHQRTLGGQAQQRPGMVLITGSPHADVDRIGDHRDRPAGHQRAATGAVGQQAAGTHDEYGFGPGTELAQLGAAIDIWPLLIGRAAGRAVAQGEALIDSGGFAEEWRAGVVLGSKEG